MAKVNYTKVLQHKGISEESLPERTKRLIQKYKEAIQEADDILKSRHLAIFNSRSNQLTENGKKKYNSALDRAEDYNGFIIDSIAEIEDESSEPVKPIDKGIIPSSTVVSNTVDSGKQKRHNPLYFGMYEDDEDDE